MMKLLMLLLSVVYTALSQPCGNGFDDGIEALRCGALLRLHIVAESDAPADQAMKQPIWDAVRETYARLAPEGTSTLDAARALLPELTEAARHAALKAGCTSAVTVSLEQHTFDARVLEGVIVPAGRYPALMIRLGDAQGHNCWGLLDPDTSLRAARAGSAEGVVWDWSLSALWEALFGAPPFWQAAPDAPPAHDPSGSVSNDTGLLQGAASLLQGAPQNILPGGTP